MPAPRSIALIDAESFYASCEAAFDPKLRGRPIVVLSNNDGCVVAANSIAKQIDPGIMFKPYFQIRAWAETVGNSRYSVRRYLSRLKTVAAPQGYNIMAQPADRATEGAQIPPAGARKRSRDYVKRRPCAYPPSGHADLFAPSTESIRANASEVFLDTGAPTKWPCYVRNRVIAS